MILRSCRWVMEKDLTDTKEYVFFQEFWKIHKGFYEPEDKQEYWDQLTDVCSKVIEKYKDTDFGRFVSEIIQTELRYIESKQTGKNRKYDIAEIESERIAHERYVIKEFLRTRTGKTVEEVLNEL